MGFDMVNIFKGYELTAEQQNCLDLFSQLKGNESLGIRAGAGATKTFTANATSTLICQGERGLYLAYNDLIVQEVKSEFPKSVDVFTTHSLAYRHVGKHYANRLKRKLTNQILVKTLELNGDVGGLTKQQFAYLVFTTLNKYCLSDSDFINETHVIKANKYAYTITTKLSMLVIKYASILFSKMQSRSSSIPVVHDFYLKLFANHLKSGLIKLSYSYVILDEAQDSPPVTQLIVKLINGRKMLVGDDNQALYAWRGADNAMAAMTFDKEASLTKCFRFGDNVADLANKALNKYGNKKTFLTGNENIDSKIIVEGDDTSDKTILCRTNAMLMSELMKSIKNGRTPFLMKNAEEQYKLVADIALLKSNKKPKSLALANFQSWQELEDYSDSEMGGDMKPIINAVNEYGVEEMKQTLDRVQHNKEDEANDVIGTGHSSKGAEFKNVKLASDFDRYLSVNNNNQQAEAYLIYVALTRCKMQLDISQCYSLKTLLKPVNAKQKYLESILAGI